MWIEDSLFSSSAGSSAQLEQIYEREQERVKGWRRETHADTELNNLSGMDY